MTSIPGRISRFFDRLRRDESGATAIVVAISLPVLVGFAGLAVDVARYQRAKTIIANAADHAALAAATVDGEDRVAVAERFFKAQVPPSWAETVKLNSVKVIDAPSTNGVNVRVSIDAQVNTLLGSVVGVNKLDVAHVAVAARSIPNLEVVMALASSGTMCSSKSRRPNPLAEVPGDTILSLAPMTECAPFNAMKKGVEEFIKISKENKGVSALKVGLVPYNYKVKFGTGVPIPALISASEPDRTFYQLDRNGFVTGAEPLAPIMGITSDAGRMAQGVARLEMKTADGPAWTRTDLPLMLAGMMLDPAQVRNFAGAEAVKPFKDKNTQKVIILFTDGSNIGCCFTNWRPSNFDNQYLYNYKPYNDEMTRLCRMLKEQGGVTIFTVLFDVKESDPGGAVINNTMARCASGIYSEPGASEDNPSSSLKCKHRQNCYNVETPEEVVRVYQDIAQNFYTATLKQ